MNKPASKEPSMDEILSSIRQIIADDDAAAAPARPTPPSASNSAFTAPRPIPAATAMPRSEPPAAPPEEDAGPLTLTPEQILSKPESDPPAMSFDVDTDEEDGSGAEMGFNSFSGEPELVDPDDIAFEPDEEEDESASFSVALDEPVEEPMEPPPAVERPAPPPPMQEPPPRPQSPPSMAQPSPMPDPQLSSDLAEELLAPTTGAAVKHTLSRLSGLSMVGSNVTLEDMIRDLLRPMLKEWLDENLPSVVERMVEKEIARISRGE